MANAIPSVADLAVADLATALRGHLKRDQTVTEVGAATVLGRVVAWRAVTP